MKSTMSKKYEGRVLGIKASYSGHVLAGADRLITEDSIQRNNSSSDIRADIRAWFAGNRPNIRNKKLVLRFWITPVGGASQEKHGRA